MAMLSAGVSSAAASTISASLTAPAGTPCSDWPLRIIICPTCHGQHVGMTAIVPGIATVTVSKAAGKDGVRLTCHNYGSSFVRSIQHRPEVSC